MYQRPKQSACQHCSAPAPDQTNSSRRFTRRRAKRHDERRLQTAVSIELLVDGQSDLTPRVPLSTASPPWGTCCKRPAQRNSAVVQLACGISAEAISHGMVRRPERPQRHRRHHQFIDTQAWRLPAMARCPNDGTMPKRCGAGVGARCVRLRSQVARLSYGSQVARVPPPAARLERARTWERSWDARSTLNESVVALRSRGCVVAPRPRFLSCTRKAR